MDGYLLKNLVSLSELTWGEVKIDGRVAKLNEFNVWLIRVDLTVLIGERLLM